MTQPTFAELTKELPPAEAIADPVASAEAVGLRYVSDGAPGIRRKRAGKGFSYTGPDGAPVRDKKTLARIKSLAIPPAWTDVWICVRADGHLQATGRDKRRRKQYRYHPQWRNVRDAAKYGHLVDFAEALPHIRRRVQRDLDQPGLPREKVLATCVRLMEQSLIRVGNEEYKRQNKSFGLTTLQDRHAVVNGSKIRFRFRAKHGIAHEVEVTDRRIARIVRRCREIPGQDLFQYLDEQDEPHNVSSGDVNDYLREISGLDVTAKDIRTWAGTVLAARFFRELDGPAPTESGLRSNVVRTIERVAECLGNTVAVCRKCYVHPAVIDAYLAGQVVPASREPEDVLPNPSECGLSAEERATLAFLEEQTAPALRKAT